MKISEMEDGTLSFIFDENESVLSEKLKNYKLVRHGASIMIYQDKKLMAHFNSFDRTFLVMDSDAYAVAELFGTKRFVVGNARAAFEEKEASTIGATKYPRDVTFSLLSPETAEEKTGESATLEQLREMYRAEPNKFYERMSDLYIRCADFTPGKTDEYKSVDALADKFCRINLENHQPKDGVMTDHIMLLDSACPGRVIGTISATICVTEDGLVDIYWYDEIVDYFTKLNKAELEQLKPLFLKPEKELTDSEKETIAKIVDPKRMEMMKILFSAARQKIRSSIKEMVPALSDDAVLNKKISEGFVRSFIRAAQGREKLYEEQLNCSATNPGIYVIHGVPTGLAKQLDFYVKTQWARKKLAEFAPVQSAASTSQGAFNVSPSARVADQALQAEVQKTRSDEIPRSSQVPSLSYTGR